MAADFVKHIDHLYLLEKNLRHEHADAEHVVRERQSTGMAIINGIEAMFVPAAKTCTPSDPLGKAIDYAKRCGTVSSTTPLTHAIR